MFIEVIISARGDIVYRPAYNKAISPHRRADIKNHKLITIFLVSQRGDMRQAK